MRCLRVLGLGTKGQLAGGQEAGRHAHVEVVSHGREEEAIGDWGLAIGDWGLGKKEA